jgi:hypothetical protein
VTHNQSRRSIDWAKLSFIAALAVAIFVYGAAVGRYQIFPFAALQHMWGATQQVFAERETILGVRPTFLIEPARHPGTPG